MVGWQALLVALMLIPAVAHPCAPAPIRDRHVALDAERVLVVFDAAKRRQELVIWPGFSGDTADFGYVVPLPSAPTVAAAEEGLFEALDRAIEPEVRHESVTEWEVGWFFGPPGDGAEMMAGAKGGVEVLMHGRVGAFEVAVLRADDPAALTIAPKRPGRMLWKDLSERVFLVDALLCPGGGRLWLIRLVKDPDVIDAILAAITLTKQAPARGPPTPTAPAR